MDYDLHQLARAGRYEDVKRLLDGGEDVNKRDDYGCTVVMAAACEGHEDVVRLLAERGADLNLVNEKQEGWTALFLATKWGHTDTVEALTQLGANVNVVDSDTGFSLLIQAVDLKDAQLVKMFIDHGADVNLQDKEGMSEIGRAHV